MQVLYRKLTVDGKDNLDKREIVGLNTIFMNGISFTLWGVWLMLFKLWIMVLLSLPVTNENLFILRAMKLSTEDMTYFSFICSKSFCSQIVIKVDYFAY